VIRPIDPRVCDIITQAQKERFTITRCSRCAGPVVHSKVAPIARCIGCGERHQLATVSAKSRRWKCDACKRLFWAVLGRAKCPSCIESAKRRARRVGGVKIAA